MSAYCSIVEKDRMRSFLELLNKLLRKNEYISTSVTINNLNYDERNYIKNFKYYFDNIEQYARKNEISLNSNSKKNGTKRLFYLVSFNQRNTDSLIAEIGMEGIIKQSYYAYKINNDLRYNSEELILLRSLLDSYDEDNVSSYESDLKEIETIFTNYINLSEFSLDVCRQKLLNIFFTTLKCSQYNKLFYERSYMSELSTLELFVKDKMKKGIKIDDIINTVRNLFIRLERQIRERK